MLLLTLKELSYILFGFCSPQFFILSKGRDKDFSYSLTLSVCSAFVIFCFSLLTLLIAERMNVFDLALLYFVLCIALSFEVISAIFLAPIEKDTSFLKLSAIRNGGSLISIMIVSVAVLFWPSLWLLVFRELLMQIIIFLAGIFLNKHKVEYCYDSAQFKKIIKYSYQLNVSRLVEILFYRMPEVTVNRFFGLSNAGQFFQSRNFLMLFLKLPNIILDQVLFASFVKMGTSENSQSYIIKEAQIFLSRVVLVTVTFVWLFGPKIFNFLYGDSWALAAQLLPSLSWIIFLASMFNFVQAYCYSKDLQNVVTLSYALGLIVFVTGFFF